MGRFLGDVQNKNVIARRPDLAVSVEAVINNTIHASGEKLARGLLLAKIIATGKYRAYMEATVKTGNAFGTGAATFGVDLAVSPLAIHIRIGDILESTAGVTLGTVLTYDPVLGTGTLDANSAAVLAAGNTFRITEATVSLASKNGRILVDEVVMESNDAPVSAYVAGYFTKSMTSVTTVALAKMSGNLVTSDEILI